MSIWEILSSLVVGHSKNIMSLDLYRYRNGCYIDLDDDQLTSKSALTNIYFLYQSHQFTKNIQFLIDER